MECTLDEKYLLMQIINHSIQVVESQYIKNRN